MFIDGLMISGYRSFGKTPQKIGPLGKINLIIGQNNSGKSNIIYFLRDQFTNILEPIRVGRRSNETTFNKLDRHIGESIDLITLGFALNLDCENLKKFRNDLKERAGGDRCCESLDKLLKSDALQYDDNTAWFTYTCDMLGDQLKIDDRVIGGISNVLKDSEWNRLWNASTGRTGGDLMSTWIPETLRAISIVHPPPTKN